jgi:hypothetical protein
MTRQLRIEYPGAFYHVTSGGNQRGRIFWETVRRLERMMEEDGKLSKELNWIKEAMAQSKCIV